MNRISKLILCLVLPIAFWAGLQKSVQAQDVYNFYFQKPASPAVINKPDEKTPLIADEAPATSAVKVETQAPVAAAQTSTSKAQAATILAPDKADGFRHWSLQLMRTLVADAFSDVYFPANQRLGFQLGYRWNKYIGVETGTTLGMLAGQWSNETGTDLWQSTIPYFGLRLNPIHLNIFGSEVLELYVATGGLIINAAFPGLDGARNGYGYYGGGVRINFGETVGLDLGVKTLANDTRYGLANLGIDLRF